jgi:hypothetical protein
MALHWSVDFVVLELSCGWEIMPFPLTVFQTLVRLP